MSPICALHASWTSSSLRLQNPYGAYTNHSRVATATRVELRTLGGLHQSSPAGKKDMQKNIVVRTTGAHPHSGRLLNHFDIPNIGRG
jgi:hypothetical protein